MKGMKDVELPVRQPSEGRYGGRGGGQRLTVASLSCHICFFFSISET
jgi:hypothetical protein